MTSRRTPGKARGRAGDAWLSAGLLLPTLLVVIGFIHTGNAEDFEHGGRCGKWKVDYYGECKMCLVCHELHGHNMLESCRTKPGLEREVAATNNSWMWCADGYLPRSCPPLPVYDKELEGEWKCDSPNAHRPHMYMSTCNLTCRSGVVPSSGLQTTTCGSDLRWTHTPARCNTIATVATVSTIREPNETVQGPGDSGGGPNLVLLIIGLVTGCTVVLVGVMVWRRDRNRCKRRTTSIEAGPGNETLLNREGSDDPLLPESVVQQRESSKVPKESSRDSACEKPGEQRCQNDQKLASVQQTFQHNEVQQAEPYRPPEQREGMEGEEPEGPESSNSMNSRGNEQEILPGVPGSIGEDVSVVHCHVCGDKDCSLETLDEMSGHVIDRGGDMSSQLPSALSTTCPHWRQREPTNGVFPGCSCETQGQNNSDMYHPAPDGRDCDNPKRTDHLDAPCEYCCKHPVRIQVKVNMQHACICKHKPDATGKLSSCPRSQGNQFRRPQPGEHDDQQYLRRPTEGDDSSAFSTDQTECSDTDSRDSTSGVESSDSSSCQPRSSLDGSTEEETLGIESFPEAGSPQTQQIVMSETESHLAHSGQCNSTTISKEPLCHQGAACGSQADRGPHCEEQGGDMNSQLATSGNHSSPANLREVLENLLGQPDVDCKKQLCQSPVSANCCQKLLSLPRFHQVLISIETDPLFLHGLLDILTVTGIDEQAKKYLEGPHSIPGIWRQLGSQGLVSVADLLRLLLETSKPVVDGSFILLLEALHPRCSECEPLFEQWKAMGNESLIVSDHWFYCHLDRRRGCAKTFNSLIKNGWRHLVEPQDLEGALQRILGMTSEHRAYISKNWEGQKSLRLVEVVKALFPYLTLTSLVCSLPRERYSHLAESVLKCDGICLACQSVVTHEVFFQEGLDSLKVV